MYVDMEILNHLPCILSLADPMYRMQFRRCAKNGGLRLECVFYYSLVEMHSVLDAGQQCNENNTQSIRGGVVVSSRGYRREHVVSPLKHR